MLLDAPTTPTFPRIESERLLLSVPVSGDAPRLLAYNQRNSSHLQPFSPPEPSRARDLEFWSEHVERVGREFRSGTYSSTVRGETTCSRR